jgi:hypothetical protein
VQAALLLLPAVQRAAEQRLAVLARLGVAHVGAAVDPGAVALQRDDRVDGGGEDVAVVGDHQDRLGGGGDAPLELALGRDVEEVVGLVEQQQRGVGAEQVLEHEPLALAAGEL